MKKLHMTLKRLLTVLLMIVMTAAFTPQMAFEAFASDNGGLTLELSDESKTTYLQGEEIYVKASGTASDAWVGLYAKGDEKDPERGGQYSFRWFYVADYDGTSVDITKSVFNKNNRGVITPGEYELILFGDGGYTNIVKTIAITVAENPGIDPVTPSDDLTLTLSDSGKTTYKIGEEVNIKATGTADGAWVGLYAEDEQVDPDNGGVTSYRWYYVGEHNGETMDITSADLDLNNRGGLSEGSYKIVLFGDSGYHNIVKTINFTLDGMIDIDETQFSLEVEKTDYKYGDAVKVRASGTGINDGAWVGLYYADAKAYDGAYLYYYYVKDFEGIYTTIQQKTAGSATEKVLGQGKYELVIFADNGYSLPVKKVSFTVTRDALVCKVLREAGCTTFGLEYVVYEDGTSEYREIQTLGGHLWTTPVQIGSTAQHQYLCDRDLDHKKLVENCTLGQEEITEQATTSVNGTKTFVCKVCKGTYTTTIPKLKSAPKLNVTKYEYTGKSIKPTLKTLYDSNGKVISKSNYTVTYPTGSKGIGVYKVKVKFKNEYSGTYTLKFEIFPKLKVSPKLKTTTFVYNGKNRKPSINTLYNTDGKEIPSEYYTVTYPSSCKHVGTYKATVTFKGKDTKTYNLSYKIKPKSVSLKSVTKGKKSFKVTWKKAASQTTGYQIAYAKNKNFKNTTYKKVKGIKNTSTTVQKLTAKKKYYIKIRTYKVVDGKTYYSSWSKVKTVTTK